MLGMNSSNPLQGHTVLVPTLPLLPSPSLAPHSTYFYTITLPQRQRTTVRRSLATAEVQKIDLTHSQTNETDNYNVVTITETQI